MRLDKKLFVLDDYLNFGGLNTYLDRMPQIHSLIKKHESKQHGLVRIMKRRAAIKVLQPLLSNSMLPYDRYYYKKEVNTASERDRQYGAEEAFLTFCLIIASGKTWTQLQEEHYLPSVHTLRDLESEKRPAAFAKIVMDETREQEMRYRLLVKEHEAELDQSQLEKKKGPFQNWFRSD